MSSRTLPPMSVPGCLRKAASLGPSSFSPTSTGDQLAEAAMEANKAATLTAQTKLIFAVTKADASVLARRFSAAGKPPGDREPGHDAVPVAGPPPRLRNS